MDDETPWRVEMVRRARHYDFIRAEDKPRSSDERAALSMQRQALEWERCRRDFWYWVRHYGWLQAPHEAEGIENPTRRTVPFLPWPKQVELLEWLIGGIHNQESLFVPKGRSCGATWVALHYGGHSVLFEPGFHMHLGSRKEELVDKRGSPGSLFEKLRWVLRRQPGWILPGGLAGGVLLDNFRTISHLEIGSSITGEATGEGFGRGDRATVVVIDEAAEVPPTKMAETFMSLESVAASIWFIYNTKNEGHPVHLREQKVDPRRIMRLDWTMDPRRKDWRKQKTLPIGNLTDEEFDREWCAVWMAGREGVIFHVARARTEFNDFDMPPPEERRNWPLLGLWDFGSGLSKTACIMVLLEIGATPRLWVVQSLEWQRVKAEVIADDVKAVVLAKDGNGDLLYPTQGPWYGDPAGMHADSEQQSWISRLNEHGVSLQPLRSVIDPDKGNKLIVNEKPWKDATIHRVQSGLDNGTIRVHVSCEHAWNTLNRWKWRIPQGKSAETSMVPIDVPDKGPYSHTGDALCYMGDAAHRYILALRAEHEPPEARGQGLVTPGGEARKALDMARGSR